MELAAHRILRDDRAGRVFGGNADDVRLQAGLRERGFSCRSLLARDVRDVDEPCSLRDVDARCTALRGLTTRGRVLGDHAVLGLVREHLDGGHYEPGPGEAIPCLHLGHPDDIGDSHGLRAFRDEHEDGAALVGARARRRALQRGLRLRDRALVRGDSR